MAKRGMIRSSIVSLTDQCLWTAIRFVAIAMAGHILSRTNFGVFSLGLSIMVLSSGIAVAMSGEALGVARGALVRDGRWNDLRTSLIRNSIRVIIVIAAISAVIVAAVCLWASSPMPLAGWAIVIMTPGAVVAEGLRAIHYGNRDLRKAFRLTMIWTACQIVSFLVFLGLIGFSVTAVLGSWILGAVSCAIFGIIEFRDAIRSRPSRLDSGWQRRRLSFAFEYLATAGPTQLTSILATPLFGVTATGALRAVQSVFGPLNIVTRGIRNFLVPTAAERFRGSALLRLGLTLSFTGGVVTGALIALLSFSPSLGGFLMGQNWPDDPALVVGFGLARLASSIVIGAVIIYRALDRSSISSPLRLLSALATIVPFVVFAAHGLTTALWMSGIACILAAACWWGAAFPAVRRDVGEDAEAH